MRMSRRTTPVKIKMFYAIKMIVKNQGCYFRERGYRTCEINIRRKKRANRHKANIHLDNICGVHRSKYL